MGNKDGDVKERFLYAMSQLARDAIVACVIGSALDQLVQRTAGEDPELLAIGLGVLAVWRVVRGYLLAQFSKG